VRGSWRRTPAAAVAALALGCAVPHTIVTIEDPLDLAAAGTSVIFSAFDGGVVAERPRGKAAFPLTVTITAAGGLSDELLTVEVMDAAGLVLARGHGAISIDPDRPGAAVVTLAAPCDATADCGDTVFCDGTTTCERGVCTVGPPPCAASSADCVVVECDEAARACLIEARNELCGDGVAADGTVYSQYCDPTRGCQRGTPCHIDVDCGDGRVCNGIERCINQRCEPGQPLPVDDGNPCTIDACLEPEGPTGLPDYTRDGQSCGGDATPRICVAGACSPARCGDGFVTAPEVCEDGNDNPNDGCDDCRASTWTFTDLVTGWGESRLDPHRTPIMPTRVHLDPFGNLYIFVRDSIIVRLDADTGLITHVAGTGSLELTGDGGPATGAGLGGTQSMVVDTLGDLYISDYVHGVIRRVDPATGTIETFAGVPTAANPATSTGDGGPASAATFTRLSGLTADGRGNLFVGDHDQIRRIDTITGRIETIHTTADRISELQYGGPSKLYFSRNGKIFRLDAGARRRTWPAMERQGTAVTAGRRSLRRSTAPHGSRSPPTATSMSPSMRTCASSTRRQGSSAPSRATETSWPRAPTTPSTWSPSSSTSASTRAGACTSPSPSPPECGDITKARWRWSSAWVTTIGPGKRAAQTRRCFKRSTPSPSMTTTTSMCCTTTRSPTSRSRTS